MIFTFQANFGSKATGLFMNKRQGNKQRNWKGPLDTLHPSTRVYFVYIY